MGRAISAMAVAVAAASLIGCGGSSSSSTTSSVATTTLTATLPAGPAQVLKTASDPNGQLVFLPPTLAAKAGKVQITFKNASPIPHGLTIEDKGGNEVATTGVFADSVKSVTAMLPAGTYTFYCPVPGHRSAGMVGVLRIS